MLCALFEHRKNLPWKELRSRGSGEPDLLLLMNAAAELTAVDSTVLFRKRDDASEALTSLWLGEVLKKARAVSLSQPDVTYRGITQEDLRRIAQKSLNVDEIDGLQDFIFETYGIVLVYEKSFSSMKLDGATAKLPNGIPVIALSLRYARYDYFWFTLLHELAHVLLHYDDLSHPILDDFDGENDISDVEAEANRLAADSLIPRRIWIKAAVHRSMDIDDLLVMAKEAAVHPTVAAGLLRKRNSNYRLFSDLVNSLDVRNILGIE
ncbi:XRE family plasmid maintenance system antidote protein [Burkholderia diffusa]|uniref:XRE family plasmid maintenance system antidote protein n=2 Tax=Burkholderia diffusa TaxID=488732 RepID=A0A6P2GPJ4_9BURK|nr:XRE family plasmid maintenance system antidote protein [Burkholderia diffusa]